MKIVKFKGGLGNQMFQYAFAKLLEKETGEKVKLDYSAFQSLINDTVRVPRINKFNLSLEPVSQEEINKICIFRHGGNSQSFIYRALLFAEKTINKKYFWEPDRAYRDISSLKQNDYLDGYWQSWIYVEEVKDELKKDFTPNYVLSEKTQVTKGVMEKENSVFVGVRRGDYAEEADHYGSFSSDYYERAMAYISEHIENPVFYVFSNDIEWCKKNINWGSYTVNFREPEYQTSDFEELMLMASCKHAIIVNSSYNWWGATLIGNTHKIVCCPEKWWLDDKPIDIIPDNWVRIKR
jgi:hypothetical protein